MADNQNPSTSDIPDAALKQKKSSGISAVWIIPIVALIIGAWLVFQNATEEKATVEVTFESASGLEAGKTVVKLRNIKVGMVKDVRFSRDLTSVVVVMEFKGIAQERFTDTTRFWVVRPRIGIGGVSGLDTLLSGAYIEIDPGEGGVPVTRFDGLEEPDIYQRGNPGTRYILSSNELGSLSRGSPVKFRGIEVGEVGRYELVDDHNHVEIEIFVRAPHDKYVKPNTRFWNVSGVAVELSAEGFQVDMDSVTSLMAGGIAFSTQDDSDTVAQAPEKTVFILRETEEPQIEETVFFHVPMKLYFDKGVTGLSVGAPLEFKGLRIGTVDDIGVEANADKTDILTFAMVDIEPDRLPSEQKTTMTDAQRIKAAHQFFEVMAARGMRAQLASGNLLTGQSLIRLEAFPTAKEASVRYVDGVMIFPTVPESLAGILDKVNDVLARIEDMPIEEIGANVEETTASINSLIKSLNAVEGGMMGVQINEAISELTRAARSMRSLAEYLERHPEALIKGKKPE
jgi:paraquat-inducible protein B